jgi:hypothetical protein
MIDHKLGVVALREDVEQLSIVAAIPPSGMERLQELDVLRVKTASSQPGIATTPSPGRTIMLLACRSPWISTIWWSLRIYERIMSRMME